MKIIRNASQASVSGSADYFTGNVRIDGMFQAEEPARVGGATVTFEPGARTAWHTHPLGQTLIVTQGRGWVGTGERCSRDQSGRYRLDSRGRQTLAWRNG